MSYETISRRNTIKSIAGSIAVIGLGTTVSADGIDSEDITSHPIKGGIFIGTTEKEELSFEDIHQVRKQVIDEFVTSDFHGVMNTGETEYFLLSQPDVGSINQNRTKGRRACQQPQKRGRREDSDEVLEEFDPQKCGRARKNRLVGYALQFNEGFPKERKFRVSQNASKDVQRARVQGALKELEAGASVTSGGGDVVDADPGWGDPVYFSVDEAYIEADHDDLYPWWDYYGKVTSECALYEGRVTNDGFQEYGCTIGCTQVPGFNIDDEDYRGHNYETKGIIDPYGHGDLPIITDWGPDGDETPGWWGSSISLDEITFGADSSGPYGEVSISPSSSHIDAQYDNTDFANDGPIETQYEIKESGNESTQQLGTSAVFVTDPSMWIICLADIRYTMAFSGDYPNSELLGNLIYSHEIN